MSPQPPKKTKTKQAEIIVIRPQSGPQEMFLSSSADIVIYGGAAGGGKALPLDTPLPTPAGWTTMGDIQPGDLLFDEAGQPCSVLAVYDVIQNPESYRLTFNDGVEMIACADHQWATITYRQRTNEHKRNPKVRAERKANRPSRIAGNKSEIFTAVLVARNKARVYKSKPWPPKPEVFTTRQIAASLIHDKGNGNSVANHAILRTLPLDLPDAELSIDPYTLGAWLGDGNTGSGILTSMDDEIIERASRQFPVNRIASQTSSTTGKLSQSRTYRLTGLTAALSKLGVLGNKHIPQIYLRGSIKQRLELLQGLMDTDGTVNRNPRDPEGMGKNCEFSTTCPPLRDGFSELLASLGIRSVWREARAKLNGKDCGPNYRFPFSTTLQVFSLKRKLEMYHPAEIQKRYLYRFIEKCEPCDSVPMRCISVDSPNRLYLAGRHMVVTHNTYGLLMEPLRHVSNAEFAAVFFRRNAVQVKNVGGLWDESLKMYPLTGARPITHLMEWKWKRGSKVKFAHLENDSTVLDWQGGQIPLICFDELTHFTEYQFFYMLSRNRSTSGIHPYVRATTNPDADSWVATLIAWWIDQETGFPIIEHSGIIRWFIRLNDTLLWGDSKWELIERYGNPELPEDHEDQIRPKSFTFIPAKLSDNKKLTEKDPNYKSNLLAMSRVEQGRLLYGNWKIRPAAGMYFNRSEITIIDEIPKDVVQWVRRWDLAATEPNEGNKNPDWTAGVLMGKRKNGNIVIAHVCHERFKSGKVRELVVKIATSDKELLYSIFNKYVPIKIGIPQDPGQAGKDQADSYVTLLAGFPVDTIRETGDKVVRADPFAARWQKGHVELVRGPWNETFITEHEAFPSKLVHDDQVDAAAGGYVMLVGSNISSWAILGR